jgi:signal transduction histidine kinase
MGKTLIFGLVPLVIAAYLLISGYEGLLVENGSVELAALHTREYLTLGILVLVIVVGGFATDILLSRPIRSLMRFLEHIDWNNPSEVKLPQSGDEVGELVVALRTTVENFNRLRERDQALSEAKNAFLSIAAHQLRTPLTRIKWALEQLRDDSFPREEREEYVGQLRASTDEMIELVGNLLNVVRIEQNRFGHDFKKADLMKLVSMTVKNFEATAHDRGLSLSLVVRQEHLPDAIIDVDGITIVVSNLISNAIDYTPKGGRITVEVTLLAGGRLSVSVADTGIGIPAGEQVRIATSFFRAANAQKVQPNGSGIGLYISRSIVERHGGTLSFTSKEGGGSTFTFSVPTEERDLPRTERDFNEFFSTLGAEAVTPRGHGDNPVRSAGGARQ